MSDVELRHLAALVAVVDEGSFGKAAAALGFTQSAVSQQIASLERAVGMPVFDRPRGPRRAELTPAGHLLVEHARSMLSKADAMDDELDRLRRGITGRLVVGTFQSVSSQILPGIIVRMRDRAPEVEVRLVESDDQLVLLDAVQSDELDVAFTVDVTDDDRFASATLGNDAFVVLAATGELTGPSATPADLNGHPLIGQTPNSVCQLLVDQRLEALGVSPEYVFRSQDNGAVQGMVRSGMGLAVMPALAIDQDDPGIEVFELDPPIAPRRIQLTRRMGRTLPPAADTFEGIALDVCRDLLKPVD